MMETRISRVSSTVINWGDGIPGEIIEETDEYLAIYQIGRSVYRDSISGTTYEPAKIIFARILEKTEKFFQIQILMRVPVRRR
jgi:hypothetical protein